MITNSSINKLKASKSSRDFEDLREGEGDTKSILSDRGEGEKNKLSNISGDSGNFRTPLPTIVICQRERPDNRLKSRPRVRDEFRMARGGPMDRRGSSIRTRGGGISRKVEREGESGVLSRGKFQESLNKGSSDSAISSSSKYYSDERCKGRLEFGYMVPEDCRISKLLRRLCREDDSEKFLVLCKQLQENFRESMEYLKDNPPENLPFGIGRNVCEESLMVPENGRYIRRSLDLIAESLLDTLHSGPGAEAKFQAAKCLGRVGYVLEQDFKRYMDWIFSKYAVERNDEVRLLLMKGMAETLRLEKEMPKLKDFSVVLMTQLQTALENTDLPDLLMGTVDVIILLTEIYPSTFTKHFRDTVDILVGWHIDGSQAIAVTQYASNSLQKLTRYWIADLQFSLTLLGQFLEDMEAYGEDLVYPTSGRSSPAEDAPPTPEDCILRITSLIRVFNTVTKSLGQNLNPTMSPTVAWSFLTDCLSKMLRTVIKALDICMDEDLIVTANECTCLLLSHLQSKTSAGNEMLYGLIDTQLSVVSELADFTIISMLKMIAKTVREVSANLPLELVQKLLGSDSPVLQLRFSPSLNIQAEVLGVYHSLLNLKNIPLLQEAYRYVLGDLEIAYKMFVPSVEELCQQNPHSELAYKMNDVERVIIFLLHALADLANASNSIIGMWALKPSILELLAVKLLLYDSSLAQQSPALQYSVLYLLYSHCSRYNHFVSSSGLISSTHGRSNVHDILGLPVTLGPEVPTTSPTSGHLSVILSLLRNMLSQETSEETRLLVLSWTRELLIQAQPYLSVLHQTSEFEKILFSVVGAGFHHSTVIVLGVAGNVEQLLTATEVPWKAKLLCEILELCVLHLNSTSSRVRAKFSYLLSLVPWYITVSKLTEARHAIEIKNKPLHELSGFTLDILHAAQRHHLSRSTYGDIQPQHFRKFMGYLLQGVQHSDNVWLQDMFCSCWPLQSPSPRSPDEDKAVFLFGNLAVASNLILLLWVAWEAAQLCVMYKLRTPLGKPQDTFTNIEGAIKNLAREISQQHGSHDESCGLPRFKEPTTPTDENDGTVSCGTWEQRRVRLLLEFLEHLEKAMHNAAEGCATAMLPPPKPVRTFFHTNKSTCAEWLTRIRTAVVVVAIHAGQATTAIRHGYCMLQDMVDANNTQGPEFERAVMYVCWALCKLREPEAIQGLYAWCKDVTIGRKFHWLKAAGEQAQGRYEAAAEGYYRLLRQDFVGSTPRTSPIHLINDENASTSPMKQSGKPETEQYILGFMADQLTECYKAVNNWTELLKWKEKEAEIWKNQNGGNMQKYLMSSVTSTAHAKALAKFEEGEMIAVRELMKWNIPGTSTEQLWDFGKNNRKCWSSYKLMGKAYTVLTSIAMTFASDVDASDLETDNIVWGDKIQYCSHLAQCHLQEGLRNMPSEFLQEAAVLQYAASGLQNMLSGKMDCNVFNMIDGEIDIDTMNSSLLTQVLWWGKYFSQSGSNTMIDDIHIQSSWVNQLMLEVSRVARKEGNLVLAQKLLIDYLTSADGVLTVDTIVGTKNKLLLEEVAQSLVDTAIKGKEPTLPISMVWSAQNARALTEAAKVLYSMEKHDSAVQVCAVASLNLAQQMTDRDYELRERGSKLLLTLAKWLQQDNQLVSGEADDDRSALGRLLGWEKARNIANDPSIFGFIDIQNCITITHNGTRVIPPTDAVIGRLLQLGVSRCPELAKAWSQFASWCYRWGRRVVDAASEAGGQLSEVDKAAVQQLMPPGMTADDLDKVYFILSQTRAVADEEDIETEDINTSEMIENQLQNVNALTGANSEQLTRLVEIWRDAQKRIYSYYELSAVAYFKYLELCGDKESICGGVENSCTTITATLRLLRLIVKHALELQSVLESGLATTPTRPWKGIIPQLFSRLSHPEPYVRRRVSELLCRVAEDAPHLITFPAVVGAAAGGARLRDMTMGPTASRLFSTCLSQPLAEGGMGEGDEDEEEEEEEEDEECASEEENQVSVLKNCFLAMVDTLSKQAPEAISQVQLLVQELRRITLLWDELWLGTLAQHHAEISRRLQQLELEVMRVEDNTSLTSADKDKLITEKHRIILKPLVFILEQLHAITSVAPETPHEKWFQEKFGEYISDALQKLKTSWNPRRPQESWQPLKQLQSRLQQRAQKRAAYTIHMSDVSPALASLKNSLIAMPGVASTSGTIITVASVDNNIAILPTKTKPKKLVFHGSDGQQYTYLFKGLEDLHLDERIMQFLSIANTMMQRSSSCSETLYRARHYSVIPLGPRSGLISWVDGVTPLFGLYKRWQQRETAAVSLRGQSSSNLQQSSGPGQVMRPSELFYSKLTPLLKEKNVANLDNRKEWPLPVLRQVLTELMDETPKDLLAKELWCHSINAGGWWQTTRTYSYSVAVMSIIGYIIGLGDRHLDNVLVDLSTGEVIHIDYNVCFEKGKTLRVPEKVPFRMTPNIRTALGVTGVEGIFRLACEHVLKVMKKGRETLLTLLEAFVYDPLIDWTPGNEAGYTGAVYGGGQAIAMETKQSRKELEREVTLGMFCVRVAEMKAEWFSNRDELMAAILELVSRLSEWLEVQGRMKIAEESLQDCHQQMALVKEAEAHGPTGQHPLYTLSTRYAKHRRARDAKEKACVALKEKIEDCEKHLNLHKAALASVRGPQLAQWVNELNFPIDKDSHMVFDLVKEFLQNAGQGQMIIQCEQSESELGQLAQQQILLVHSCLDLLSQYGTVASLYPASYLNSHRSVCYRRWAQQLVNNMSVESCQEVVAQFQALFSPETITNKPLSQQVLAFSYQLQTSLAEANARLKKSYECLAAEGLPESAVRLEAAYNEAHAGINAFLRGEQGAAMALECVNITALCALNKRYLMMEAAALSAGDCLVDLTSREGDWFLDEMYLVSTLVTELASLLPSHHQPDSTTNADTRVELVLQCLKSAHSIYKGLQELNFNFHTIILPEALKTIQTEEPTVLTMVNELDDIIASVGCPLEDLLGQLEVHLRFIIMEMDSPHRKATNMVAEIRKRFEMLLLRPAEPNTDEVEEGTCVSTSSGGGSSDDVLTPGQMLLMGFNGLFEKLQLEGNALIAALGTLDTPHCWKKVDQVWEAKAMAAPVFNDATRAVLEDIFLLKRLSTMQQFFSLCGQVARGVTSVHDDDHLNKPIRRFTADYVSRQLLGVTSQTLALALCLLLHRTGLNVTVEVEQRDIGAENKVSLEELCRKAVDLCMKRNQFSGSTLAQASGLTSTLEATWRRREVARHLQQQVEAQRSTLQRLQLQLTAHHWLHEDTLMLQGAAITAMAPINRPTFMLELRKTSSALLALQPRLTEARDQQNALVVSVEQRLKWAAGANPALSEVMAAFESAVSSRSERLNLEQRLSTLVGNTCNAILHHEALRTRTSEGLTHDASFLQLVEQCEKSCVLSAGCEQVVTPAEESLVQLLPPDGPIDQTWIHNAEMLISDSVKSLQQQMVGLQETLFVAQDSLKTQVIAVRNRLSAHHKLMSDVRNLLKSMVKLEDCGSVGLQEYVMIYRTYSEQFSALIRELMSDELDVDRVNKAMEQLEDLKEKTNPIYEELVMFANQQEEEKQEQGSVSGGRSVVGEEAAIYGAVGYRSKRPPLLRQDSVCLSPRKGVPVPTASVAPSVVIKPGRDPHTGKAVQERNAYALGVWRRVRMKLEGRDPDPGRRATVPEQVEYVIREAMSLDNLALLYEGWTPWV